MPQTKIPDHIIPALLCTDGLLSIFLALFAFSLGLDPNPDWGRSRIVLFFIGLFLTASSFFLFTRKPAFTKSETIKSIMLFGHVWAILFIIYASFITFGNFTTWKASTRYYTLLADAFGKGQLHVDVEPGVALLAANDPYSSESRPAFDDDVWDLSLYKGKLYLYWGPVPALLLTPFQLFTRQPIADIYLVFFFFCGLLIFNTLIILKLWRHLFSDIPARNVVASIFLIGLILPILWSLNIPDVYEAAIGAGQFFLIGGMYFVILAFEKDIKMLQPPSPAARTLPGAENIQKQYLFLAGFFWACSVGSRAIHVLPILFLTTLTIFWIWKKQPKPIHWNGIIRLAASLLTPLALGAILIGWYNWTRFDSPLEFGLRYQITIYNLNRDMPLTFQPDYFPFNFHAYIFQPFEFISKFPFIQPVGFSSLLKSLNITAPKLYASGRMTGILFYAPILLLAFLPFFSKNKAGNQTHPELQKFIQRLFGGSFLISFAAILFYFYGQMRFMADPISQVTLLAILGYWLVVRNSKTSKIGLHLANLLIVITITVSILLAFSSETSRMEKLNPILMEKINSFFIWQR
ncbi:MAG: hypothetical protein HZB18_04720 [Chloroflexi bacterium]|nr:hypothetical protein [Chloroflexota bacterium]